MKEIFLALPVIWNYTKAVNFYVKLIVVTKKYFQFVRWFIKNPEVKIKYSRLITTKVNNNFIKDSYDLLVDRGIQFEDSLEKSKDSLSFSLLDSHLSYMIKVDHLSKYKDILCIETKYMPYYPFRNFSKLNEITSEFNRISELIQTQIKASKINHVIFMEIKSISTDNKMLQTHEKFNAEITFKGNRIQINNFHGSEQGELLFFFLMEWIQKYK